MAGVLNSVSNNVKKGFSATESYLLTLKETSLAVLRVLRPRYREPSLPPMENVITTDIHHEYDESKSLLSMRNEYSKSPDEDLSSDQIKQSPLSCLFSLLCYPLFPCLHILPVNRCFPKASSSSCSPINFGCTSCLCTSFTCSPSCGTCKQSFQCLWNATTVLSPFILLVFLFWKYYDSYISQLLNSFEAMNEELAILIFIVLFTVASLPLVWGYVVLNLAAGYRFGVFFGVVVVIISVTVGLSATHRISQRFCSGCIFSILKRQTNADHIENILKVLDSPSGLKVIALTRLTPIPFGLQNGIFAVSFFMLLLVFSSTSFVSFEIWVLIIQMSKIQTRHYVAASNIGLFPTQVLNCYIGSTFHSAEDILSRGGTVEGYLIYVLQVSSHSLKPNEH